MATHIVIPARLRSQRLPGKLLLPLQGKALIAHTVAQACLCASNTLTVAADDSSIIDCVSALGVDACMTSSHQPSGTMRIAELACAKGWADDDVVLGWQADEPFLPSDLVAQLFAAAQLSHVTAMVTAYRRIDKVSMLFDPSVVKVVLDHRQKAMCFSRAPIPWCRDLFSEPDKITDVPGQYYEHIGVYAYRVGFLKRYAAWPACELEQLESLEQCRVLYHGESIHCLRYDATIPGGIDTAADLAAADAYLAQMA